MKKCQKSQYVKKYLLLTVKEDPESLTERLLEMNLGHVLQWVNDHGHKDEMIERYLRDFVHMVYKAQTEEPNTEYKVRTV